MPPDSQQSSRRAILVGGLIGLAALVALGASTKSALPTPLHDTTKSDELRIRKTVEAAYGNEHFHPSESGKCWLPGSPAQEDLKDELPQLSALSKSPNHLPPKPDIQYVKFYEGGYAVAGTTEQWAVRSVDDKGNPVWSLRPLSRAYYLKEVGDDWKVYRLTRLPLSNLKH